MDVITARLLLDGHVTVTGSEAMPLALEHIDKYTHFALSSHAVIPAIALH